MMVDLDAYGPGRVQIDGRPGRPLVRDPDGELHADPVRTRRAAAAHAWLAIVAMCPGPEITAWEARIALLVVNDLDDLFAEGLGASSPAAVRERAVARARVAHAALGSAGVPAGAGETPPGSRDALPWSRDALPGSRGAPPRPGVADAAAVVARPR